MDGHKLPYYRLPDTEVLTELRTNEQGLTEAEAADRLKHVGPNQLERTHHTPMWWILIRQFKNLLVIILLVSAGFALYLHDGKTTAILLFIALMNAVVGFFQEYKAESLLSSLERLVVPRAKVLATVKSKKSAAMS